MKVSKTFREGSNPSAPANFLTIIQNRSPNSDLVKTACVKIGGPSEKLPSDRMS